MNPFGMIPTQLLHYDEMVEQGVWGIRVSSWLRRLTMVQVSCCVAATTAGYLLGNWNLLVFVLQTPGTAFLVTCAVLEVTLCRMAHASFAADEPMRNVWLFQSGAAACRLLGILLVHVIPRYAAGTAWSEPVRRLGQHVAGPLAIALTAVALLLALRIYRELDMVRGISWSWTPAIAVLVVYNLRQMGELVAWIADVTMPLTWDRTLDWMVDPLLLILVVEAALLHRTARPLAGGFLGRCWLSYVLAVVFTALGNVVLWGEWAGFYRWPTTGILAVVWYPAAAAFAAAPAYQLEAFHYAHRSEAENKEAPAGGRIKTQRPAQKG